ncbi:hypothetical protein HBB16_12665 [Pseudonocardia sp. MCCB 268]|nr:hypothetical protein [Pseudonocardia cytotoxica]
MRLFPRRPAPPMRPDPSLVSRRLEESARRRCSSFVWGTSAHPPGATSPWHRDDHDWSPMVAPGHRVFRRNRVLQRVNSTMTGTTGEARSRPRHVQRRIADTTAEFIRPSTAHRRPPTHPPLPSRCRRRPHRASAGLAADSLDDLVRRHRALAADTTQRVLRRLHAELIAAEPRPETLAVPARPRQQTELRDRSLQRGFHR